MKAVRGSIEKDDGWLNEQETRRRLAADTADEEQNGRRADRTGQQRTGQRHGFWKRQDRRQKTECFFEDKIQKDAFILTRGDKPIVLLFYPPQNTHSILNKSP
jgi:hypothetical protein